MSEYNEQKAVRRGSILLDQGRYQEAEEVFKDELQKDPEDPDLLHLLATSQYHLPNKSEQALVTIHQAIRLEPDESYHYELKAMILESLERHDDALESIQEALELSPESSQAYAVESYIYVQKNKWIEAEESARKSLSLYPENLFAGNMLLTSLNMQNKLDEGTFVAEQLLHKDPEDYISHSTAGWTYMHKKNYEQAQVHFKESLRLNPNFEPARVGMLETYKSRSWFYRMYLSYAMFMARRSQKVQWVWILGIYLVFKIILKTAQNVLDGPYAPLAYVMIGLVYLLFFWTWVSGGIGNLMILCDQYARNALNKNEKLDGIFVGGMFIGGFICLLLSAFSRFIPGLVLGGSLMLSVIPFTVTFVNEHPVGRYIYGLSGALIVLTGVLVCSILAVGLGLFPVIKVLIGFSFLVFVLSTWLGAFGVWRK